MEHFSGIEQLPICRCQYCGQIVMGGDGCPWWDGGPERAGEETSTGGLPRMFALVQEFDEDDEIVTEVMAYGLALPEGGAATVGVAASGFGRWISADSAASRLGCDLVWISEIDARTAGAAGVGE
ncbi:hypothetical protein AB0B56_28800 [Streptosporangium canum]|uniref:hypothetical protein n=1 Tax=Streptosporangium canum TaxID=324952 RepID=UPI00343C7040